MCIPEDFQERCIYEYFIMFELYLYLEKYI